MEAQEWCRKYMKSGTVKDLTQAWDLYYHVFRRISKQLPQVGSAGSHRVNCHYNPFCVPICSVLVLIPKHLVSLCRLWDKALLFFTEKYLNCI